MKTCLIDNAKFIGSFKWNTFCHIPYNKCCNKISHPLTKTTSVCKSNEVTHKTVHNSMTELMPNGGIISSKIWILRVVGSKINSVVSVISVIHHSNIRIIKISVEWSG